MPLFSVAQLSPNQQAEVDSLNKIIETATHDTIIVKAWSDWDNIIYLTHSYLDFKLNIKIDSLCSLNLKKEQTKHERKYFLKSKAFALNNLGSIYKLKGDYDKAITYYTESLEIKKINGNKSGMAASLNNIGIVYNYRGDYAKAIKYYTQSLRIREELGNKSGIAASLNNIGSFYQVQGDYAKAIEFHTKSLKLKEEIGDKSGVATTLNNMGLIYREQGEFDKALDNYTKNFNIYEEIGDIRRVASTLSNIGIIHHDQGNYTKALEYYEKSIKLKKEVGAKSGVAMSYHYVAAVYEDLGNYNKAIHYGKLSLNIAQEIGNATNIRDASQLLWKVNKKLGKSKVSLEMYELYVATKDSLVSQENQKAILQQEYKYAYEKQAAADSVKAAEVRLKSDEANKVKDALLLAENKQRQQQQYFLYAGLFIALLFGGLIYNRFHLANEQKTIIEQQKQKVDKAYKEITDSINYAERIQRSFLATKETLDVNLTNYFVFFKPKNVVSGDFYWAGTLGNGNFAVINADSTGHGVPGAIMSILNISSIEKAIEQNATNPADIFNRTRKTIIERLRNDGSKHGGKDGMDASIICFNPDKTKMTYTAAQNPIWIIRDGALTEIKPEKMPLGMHHNDHIPFKGGEFDLKKGDQIYTLTDGFQDQFGGPKGKKFMIKKMREYILSVSNFTMEEQHQKIEETFHNWKGKVEQVDDICVIGIII